MSCRLPGATNVEEFWQNLQNGVESVTFFSDEELESEGIEPALLSQPNYIARAVLSDIEMFDASFFGLYLEKLKLWNLNTVSF
ncbi:beta-ketoacyl synthase N-terminal-like domain-containing protein [Nostoc sp.]